MHSTNEIKLLAWKIRRDIVQMIGCKGQTGHLGGSCSSAEIVAALYGRQMRLRPDDPQWDGRDKFIYSKGHAAIAQYAAMAEVGYFPREELWRVKELGSMLQGHPDRLRTPGIDAGTGSLGQGLSIAVGMALAMRLDGHDDNKVYCVMGDGEMAEGQIWEAAMAAVNFKLDNLVGIVDRNRLQATGFVEERFNTNPLAEKWAGFGWAVLEIDGHDVDAILAAFEQAAQTKGVPTVIIANTVKGKGICFAENQAAFHNGLLSREQYDSALAELDADIAGLCQG
ncbi:MAG: transketolase [Clostridiales bacterium]|nr:transketolase [Clostridiales bacterium]